MFTGLVNIRPLARPLPIVPPGIIISRAGLAVIFRIVRIFRKKARQKTPWRHNARSESASAHRGGSPWEVYHADNGHAFILGRDLPGDGHAPRVRPKVSSVAITRRSRSPARPPLAPRPCDTTGPTNTANVPGCAPVPCGAGCRGDSRTVDARIVRPEARPGAGSAARTGGRGPPSPGRAASE